VTMSNNSRFTDLVRHFVNGLELPYLANYVPTINRYM